MLRTVDLTLAIAERALVQSGSVQVADGEVVALVGRNGVGKSTLLGALAGAPGPEVVVGGHVQAHGEVAWLLQESTDLDDLDVLGLDFVIGARDLVAIEREMGQAREAMAGDPSEDAITAFVELEERYRLAGGYECEAAVTRICTGLGLDENLLLEPMRSLSGGQRRRLALARVLYSEAPNLILDEPTNHLDAAGKRWLKAELESTAAAVLIVSHDLPLLDTSVDRVVELREGRLTSFPGNYANYRRLLEERMATAAKHAAGEDREIKRLKNRADSMRGRTQRLSRIAKGIDQRVVRLEERRTERIAEEGSERLRLPPASRGNATPVAVEQLSVEYDPGSPVLDGLSFSVARADRLLVLGVNGAGKSSLLRCLVGAQAPTTGTVTIGSQTSVGYFAQQHEALDPARSAFDHLCPDLVPSRAEARNLLGSMGLSGAKAMRPVSTLSGGERTKASLALLVSQQHNLLVLDEPTNNLDVPAAGRLGDLLGDWGGTLIVVTHDVSFVKQLAPTHRLLLPEQELRHWQPVDINRVAM